MSKKDIKKQALVSLIIGRVFRAMQVDELLGDGDDVAYSDSGNFLLMLSESEYQLLEQIVNEKQL